MTGRIILLKEFEQAERDRKKIIAARNKASSLIEDATARYIKEKTRAKSKKAALEKDAVLNSDRFKVLEDYERFEDINESYGFDCITARERDRLEELWEEREQIRNSTTDGIYSDEVTEVLHSAWIFIQDYKDEDVQKLEAVAKAFEDQRKEAEADAADWLKRQNEEYYRLKKDGSI